MFVLNMQWKTAGTIIITGMLLCVPAERHKELCGSCRVEMWGLKVKCMHILCLAPLVATCTHKNATFRLWICLPQSHYSPVIRLRLCLFCLFVGTAQSDAYHLKFRGRRLISFAAMESHSNWSAKSRVFLADCRGNDYYGIHMLGRRRILSSRSEVHCQHK